MKKLSENTKKIIKVVGAILGLALISLTIYLILYSFGWTDKEIIASWLYSWGDLAWVVFIAVRVLCTIFLSFVLACSMIFDGVAILLFKNIMGYSNWKIFFICFVSVLLASVIMDLIGRFGGTRAIIKLVGKDTFDEAQDLVQEKGLVYIPVMYLLPVFPDDAICLVAGATKIKFWIHFLEIFFFRGFGCAFFIFFSSIIPEGVRTFTSKNLWDYVEVLTIAVFWVFVVFKIARTLDIWLTKKLKSRNKEEQEVNE